MALYLWTMASHGDWLMLLLLIFVQLTKNTCLALSAPIALKDLDLPVVSIQSGRQKIQITGRDAFDGYFTKVTFPKQRCINGLTVDSLTPLTGAEDMAPGFTLDARWYALLYSLHAKPNSELRLILERSEIIFSPCAASKISWKLVHYRNQGAHFSLDQSILAMELSVVSRSRLPIVDISIESCNVTELQQGAYASSICDVPVIAPMLTKIQRDHKLRHHQNPHLKIAAVETKKSMSSIYHRMKRQTDQRITADTTYELSKSPYNFQNDWIIPPGITATIEPGVELRFAAGTGAVVYGSLIANGTILQPIKFLSLTSSGPEWRGLNFQQNFVMFDVRLTTSEFGNDGFLQVFDDDSQQWRSICGLRWTNSSANVACKQLGFAEGGSAAPTPSYQVTEKGNFWLSAITCEGNETNIEQCSKSFAQDCSVPPAAVVCKGSADRDTNKPSVLEHVNVTESLYGITVTGRVPKMNHVVSQNSRTNGFTFDIHYDPRQVFNPEITKLTAVNNRNNGIRVQINYPSRSTGKSIEPSFTLRQAISASNRENGLIIRGSGRVLVERSSFFTNTLSGVDCAMNSGHAEFSQSLSASNSLYSWHIVHDGVNSTGRYEVLFNSCNITGHFHDAAIAIFNDNNSDITINNCIFWENYNGAIYFGPFSKSDVKITNSNFTRNRGRLVYFDNVAGGSNLLLDQNLFSLNQLTNHSARQAIVSVHVGRDDPGITVKLSNNLFHKNTMERTITVEDNRDAPAYQLRLNIERNEFRDNLSPDVLLVDVPSANVTLNQFEDPQAKCELRTGPYRDGTRIDATSNYWGTIESAQVAKRVCDFKQQSTLLPAHYIPFMTDLPSGLPGGQLNHLANLEQPPTFGSAIQPIIASDDRIALGGALRENDVRIPATGDPYRVAQSVMIEQGQTLTIEPGARLEFEGGRGLRVRGKLIIRGTPENPVILTGSSQNAWSGIIFDNQNSDQASSVEGCMIENALTGMVINSKQIHLTSCRIVNSILSSIEIGPQSDTNIDFGDSLLEKSLDKGIRVATRALGITLQNVRITDSAGVGVDFDAPSEDITISNVKIANSGLFAVRIDQVPRFPIRSITIDGLTVSEQQRGQVGLFLNVLDYASVTVKNSLFTRNTVPSIQMELKCNYAANSDPSAPTVVPVPTFLFEENRIIDNSNLVATFSLAYCADATFRKNNFELNNRDHRFGTFELIAEPAPDQQKNFKLQISENVFLKNEGEYTVYLLPIIQYPFQGSFDQNKLTSNSNLRSALIVGSPLFKVNLNDFINPQSTYDLEAEYNDDSVLDATQNYWGSNLPEAIARRVLDGNIYATRGKANYRPFLTRTEPASGCQSVNECSGHGVCTGVDQCQCNSGFAGADCSQFSCVDVSSCGQNGKCSGPNTCICNAGWFGTDCSRPTCAQVNDCSGHGTCVSLNECSCFVGFSGADCSIGACQNNCNSHGVCQQNGQCQCYGGWLPPFCATADCSALHQCSNAGLCAAPNVCECFNGYSGLDCSECVSGDCAHVQCDFRCAHGQCDQSTRTCICAIGWTGAACDICAPGAQCQSQPVLFYILPQSGPMVVGQDFRVHAIGQDFPSTTDDRYICQYGTQSAEGRWLTSGVVSCPVPSSPTLGQQAFNLVPLGQAPLPVSENRRLSFTFYESCNRQTCNGICIGSKCLCEANQTGINCQQLLDAPTIDQSVLNKPETTAAAEGSPYSVQLVTTSNSLPVVWSILGPEGMTINPESGMVTWSNPIGAAQPHSIEATAHSVYGSSSLKWTLKIEPTYTPKIDHASQLNETSNFITISGHVDYISSGTNATVPHAFSNVPVTLNIFHNNQLEKELNVIANVDGKFEERFVPQTGNAGYYQVVAIHPGTIVSAPTTADSNSSWLLPGLNITHPDTITFNTGETLQAVAESTYVLKNIGSTVLSDFNITVISPSPEVEIQAIQAGSRIIPANGEITATVKFVAEQNPFVLKELLLLFNTSEGVRTIAYQSIKRQETGPSWTANPAEIVLSSSISNANENLELTLTNQGEASTSPLEIRFLEESPLYLVASNPPLTQTKDKVVLTLGILPENVPITGAMNGSFEITSQDGQELLTIPYSMRTRATELFNLLVVVNDETTYLSGSRPPINGVEVRLINPAEGFSDTRYTARNEPAVFYSIGEGMYELVLAAAGHEPLSLMVQATQTNNRLTVFLPLTIVTFLPTVSNGRLSLAAVIANDTVKQDLPALIFSPSALLLPENFGSVLITAENHGGSTIVIPEYHLETNSALPFLIKVPAVLSSFGPGESYEFPIQITTNTQGGNLNTNCDAFVISVPYFYKLQDQSLKRFAKLMVQRKSPHLPLELASVCEVDAEKGTISQVPIAASTDVSCDCAVSTRRKCQDSYHPAAACGSAFTQISNATSLESLAEVMMLLSNCKLANVDLRLVDISIDCALSLDKNCPSIPSVVPLQSNPNAVPPVQAIQSGPVQVVQPFISPPRQRRRRQIQTKIVSAPVAKFEPDAIDSSLLSTDQSGNGGAGNFFNQISLLGNVAQTVDSSVSELFPIFNVLDSTPANVIAAFHQLFEKLWRVIGDDFPGSSEYFQVFFDSIADSSPGGQQITAEELSRLANHTTFALRWNKTASAWAIGQAEPSAGGRDDFISYLDASQLISMVTRINELTRQSNVINPFTLLDGKLTQLLTERGNSATERIDRCAEATVIVRPAVIGEEQALFLTASVRNVRSSGNLNRIRLAVAFEKESADSQEILFSFGQPRLDGISSLGGTGILQPGGSFTAEWRILTNPRLRLTKDSVYQANVLLSFENSLTGQISTQRLDTTPLIFHPKPALKIFYFLYTTISPQDTTSTTRPFTAMAAIMNAGYSDFGAIALTDTRLKIVSILDQTKMIGYKLADVNVNNNATEPTFHVNIPKVPSGTTAYIRYNLTVEEVALVQDFSVAVMMDGGPVPIADKRKFFIEHALPDRLLVTVDGRPSEFYLYSLKTAGISEISQLQFWRSSDENADIDGQSYRRHRVIFRYPDSTGRSTTVYGRTILPFDVASDFKPVRIIQMVANGSSAEREINLYNFWVTNDADGTALHILDTDLSLPPQEATVTYEFLFGDPGTLGANFGGPRFGTNTYQFDMTIRTPVRTSVGSLTATSSEGSKIMYKLYGGNGYFAIRPETGEIMLERSLPLNASRYCLTVAGVDEQGRKQLAPVTIRLQDLPQNVNDPQCNVLPNVELLPAYIHVDDDDAAGNATTRRSSATNTFTSVTRASSASTPTTPTLFSVNTVTTRNRTGQSGSVTDNSITTALPFPSPSSLAPSEISSTPSGPTTRVALSSSANEITVATPSGPPSVAATSTVASIFTTSLTSLPTSRASTELSPALSSEGSTQSTNAILLTTLFATTESVVRNDLTTTTRNPDTGGQVDQPAGSSAPDITPPNAGISDRSLDEKKLMDMACKLKDTKPIWGIICDLSKTTQNNQK